MRRLLKPSPKTHVYNLKSPQYHQTPVTHISGPQFCVYSLHIGQPHVAFSRADVGAHSRWHGSPDDIWWQVKSLLSQRRVHFGVPLLIAGLSPDSGRFQTTSRGGQDGGGLNPAFQKSWCYTYVEPLQRRPQSTFRCMCNRGLRHSRNYCLPGTHLLHLGIEWQRLINILPKDISATVGLKPWTLWSTESYISTKPQDLYMYS